MKSLKKAVLAALLLASAATQASTVTWNTTRMEGTSNVTFQLNGVKVNALAGAIVGNISGWGVRDGEYYSFCSDPSTAYSSHFDGTATPITGELGTFLSYIYYGMRGAQDYASAQLAVWEGVVDVAQGISPDFATGSFVSGDALVQGAIDILDRGMIVAATAPAVQFWNIDPYDQSKQSFAISTLVQTVPEPASAAMVALGLFGLWGSQRRRTV